MTRIISGRARGRRLSVPDNGTRPTSDRVREALFSSLEANYGFEDATALDLYAGTGALGLEASSRGARYALLIESDRKAAAIIRKNIATTGAIADVRQIPAETASLHVPGGGGFDFVFIDPPYALETSVVDTLIQSLVDAGSIAVEGVVVIERTTRSAPCTWPKTFTNHSMRKYGDTRIEIAVYDPER